MDKDKPTWRGRLSGLRARIPRSATSDVFDISGLGCLVGAAFWWAPIAGLVTLGLALLLAGWVTSD
ncbi:hypothetical protein DT019_08545 [Streptomyces sp. SDr-06]|nr:hypothetical protein DT019_08545 [Streptomyces sp. SDr-06]